MMSQRIKNVFSMTAAMAFGFTLYVVFRPQTYIAKAVAYVFPIEKLQIIFGDWDCPFMRFYFPDLLWSFSLGCGLIAVFCPGVKGNACCCLAAVILGALWEAGQYFKLLSGTGDLFDIVMYLFGACFCMLINLKEK